MTDLLLTEAWDELQELLGPNVDLLGDLHSNVTVATTEMWDLAAQTISLHFERVIRNNPAKTLVEILARPDVREVIDTQLAQAAASSTSAIQAAIEAARLIGEDHAELEMAALGLEPTIPEEPPHSPFLDQVLDDVASNSSAALTNALQAAADAFAEAPGAPENADNVPAAAAQSRATAVRSAIERALANIRQRIRAGASVAVTRANGEAQAAVHQATKEATGANIRHIWLADFTGGNVPCGMCQKLHGTVVDVDEEFSSTATFNRMTPVFHDLQHPPRHPNCRCRIMVFVDQFEQDQQEALNEVTLARVVSLAAARSIVTDKHGTRRVIFRRTDGTFGVGAVFDFLSRNRKGRSGRAGRAAPVRALRAVEEPELRRRPDFVYSSDIRATSAQHQELAARGFRVCMVSDRG